MNRQMLNIEKKKFFHGLTNNFETRSMFASAMKEFHNFPAI